MITKLKNKKIFNTYNMQGAKSKSQKIVNFKILKKLQILKY